MVKTSENLIKAMKTLAKKKQKMKIIVFSALGISKVCSNLESVYTRKITDYW